MRVPFYDIRAQYDELAEPMSQIVQEVLESGAYMMGKHCQGIEAELAALHHLKHGIAVNSGTDALRILLDAAGVGPGDEVITTAFTFVASTEVIVQTGATPIFVEIRPDTFDMDPARIEEALTSKTKAIMPIHLYGQMADMEPIMKIAKEHSLSVIEDAAQALGCQRNGTAAGKFGIGGGLSFYVTKNLGAAGDAGMIITDDDRVAELCRSIRVHGMGRERYYYDHVGYTSRMDEIQAAILRVKLTRLAAWTKRRAEIAAIYSQGLQGTSVRLPIVRSGNNHTWHQYCVTSDRREALMTNLKGAGVDSMIYYPVPIHFHEPYRKYGRGEDSLPITEQVSNQILSLPMHPHLSDEQAMHVVSVIRSF